MTLRSFLNLFDHEVLIRIRPCGKGCCWKVTVAKHDDRQLSAHTTVPVSDCRAGSDWTENRLIIEPAVKLATKKEN